MQTESKRVAVVQAVKAREVTLHTGTEAWALLEKGAFLTAWDELYESCPWATVFQSRAFVTTWYQIYKTQYNPILITMFDGTRLSGLLTLTRNKKGIVTGAGESQAEYQVWLTTVASENTFVPKALQEIRKHFPNAALQLKYIPSTTPMNWSEEDPNLQKHYWINTVRQPLMKIDAAYFSKELQKKNRREKVNRLKRLGELQLERITSPEVFTSILDELTFQYDFRKIVMHNRLFFFSDPLRKKFIRSLFEQGLLHTTVLKVNGEIIASNVGAMGKKWVHLQGINTHSPLFAKYSPGILHFLMMGKLMVEEGVAVFDLTPGADSYKDQLATDYTSAFVLQMDKRHRMLMRKLRQFIVQQVKGNGKKKDAIKENKKRIGLLKEKLKLVIKQRPAFLINSLALIAWKKERERHFVLENRSQIQAFDGIHVSKNSIRDLLFYEPKDTWVTKQVFLQSAMQRFEAGLEVYSISENDRLMCNVWVEVQRTELLVCVVLQGLYYSPLLKDRLSFYLNALVQEIMQEDQVDKVYLKTRDNHIDKVLNAMGFREEVSLEVGSLG